MANYPAYQYQPQLPYGQQPVYPMQGYQQPQQTQEQALFCRMATNREEVQAFPVDFSGRPMTFLGPGLQTIWVKAFNPNTGGSDVAEFRRAPAAVQEEQERIAAPSLDEFQALKQAVAALQEDVSKLRTTRRRTVKEDDDEV